MADEICTGAVMDDFGCNGYVILLNRANCSLQISGRTPFVQYIRSSILFLNIELRVSRNRNRVKRHGRTAIFRLLLFVVVI